MGIGLEKILGLTWRFLGCHREEALLKSSEVAVDEWHSGMKIRVYEIAKKRREKHIFEREGGDRRSRRGSQERVQGSPRQRESIDNFIQEGHNREYYAICKHHAMHETKLGARLSSQNLSSAVRVSFSSGCLRSTALVLRGVS